VDEVADFRKYVLDKDQPNIEDVVGNVLIPLNGIRDQKQFRIRQVGDHGFTEFHAKHLSTTQDWGEAVSFLRYIPTSPMWVAPQMALKSATGIDMEKAGDEHGDANNTVSNNNLETLAKYRKAIIDDGFNYFRDEDKLWWVKFFENQEEILNTYLQPAQWRFEWMWPTSQIRVHEAVAETIGVVGNDLLEKIARPQQPMYSRRRKATPVYGDYRDLEPKQSLP